jgi:hypothetical protein
MEKKVVYTLALKGYPNELTDLTFPWIKHYAKKIGAEFHVIEERKFPEWPPTAEKMQLYELGKNNDWTIFIDADAIINPELFDVTAVLNKDTVMFTGQDFNPMRSSPPSIYAKRDGRYLGACTWFVVCSDWTIDLWRPLDHQTREEIIAAIWPTNGERMARIGDGDIGITSEKLIEDHICGENIARFGLKHTTLEGHIKPKFGRMYDAYYWHQYTMRIDNKIVEALKIMGAWGMITPEVAKKYASIIRKIAQQLNQAQGQGSMIKIPGMPGFPDMPGQ